MVIVIDLNCSFREAKVQKTFLYLEMQDEGYIILYYIIITLHYIIVVLAIAKHLLLD